MGLKQSKIDGHYLPDTPKLRRAANAPQELLHLTPINAASNDAAAYMDPRSPHICRTPLFLAGNQQPAATTAYEFAQQETSENALGALRKRLFKGLTFNLNDPRSPTVEFNRTPIVLDDSKDFDLNDTFSDLMVETRAEPVFVGADEIQLEKEAAAEEMGTDSDSFKSIEAPCFLHDEETMACNMPLPQTPLMPQQDIDPRSPTLGIERTALIFEDELPEGNESAMLEHVLEAMSLDNSNASESISNASLQAQAGEIVENKLAKSVEQKPKNKHLERVRISGGGGGRLRKRVSRIRHEIYVDAVENLEPAAGKTAAVAISAASTPKKRKYESHGGLTPRTPLGQIKNRQTRSRSAEAKDKSLRTHLTLTSFDDSLNPLQNASVASLRSVYDI